ncbi:MAG TPA: TonB-dependent receptor plug domain-containing protein, partial [Calditrichia bacterium]|nr:TonB-dependent receptor plug domain-containing protein [Calditrichia bacterium]
MKAYLSLAFLIWSLFSIPTLAGGPPSSLKLMDAADKKPIEGVTFHYGDQHGISAPAGMITLSILENQSLVFSHIAYGTWTLSDGELADAVKAGVLYRAQRPIEVQPVTVIHVHPRGEDVEQLALDVEDKLSHDAGAILNQNAAISSIRKSGSYGFDPVFRGFKYDQLNLVIDGAQCATAACPNRMDPPASQVAPNMMERVEILKGPHSFRYGTAFGGTVNFESAPLSFSERPQVYGRWSGSSESNGGIYRTEGMGGFRGNRYNLNLFGSFSNGEDYEDGGGVAVPARFQRASAGARLGVSVTENQDLTLSITHNNAQDTQFPALPMDLRSDKTWLFNARYEGRFSGGALSRWSTTAFATSVDHLMDNLDKVLVPRMMDARTDATTLNYGGRSETTWMLGYARLYAGLDLRVEKAEGDRTRSFLMGPMAGRTVYDNVWNGGEVAKAGAFGEYHRAFDDFRMVMSGRLEVNKSRATDLNEGFAAN